MGDNQGAAGNQANMLQGTVNNPATLQDGEATLRPTDAPANILTALRNVGGNAALHPPEANIWSIIPPVGALLPVGDAVALSRTQKAHFIASLSIGARVRIVWFLAASLEDEASELCTWNGVVISIADNGQRLVSWDIGCANLEEGGNIPLPAPDIDGRLVQIVWAFRGKRPPSRLNLSTLLVGDVPGDTKKRPRDMDETTVMILGKTVATLNQIMDAKMGEEIIEKNELAPGLRVPQHITSDFRPFYLHEYARLYTTPKEAADAWKSEFKDVKEKWSVSLAEEHNKDEMWAIVAAVHSYILASFNTLKNEMVTKEAWFMPFYLLSRVLSLCIVGVVKRGPGEAAIRFRTKMKDEWEKTPCTINFPLWYRLAKGSVPIGTAVTGIPSL